MKVQHLCLIFLLVNSVAHSACFNRQGRAGTEEQCRDRPDDYPFNSAAEAREEREAGSQGGGSSEARSCYRMLKQQRDLFQSQLASLNTLAAAPVPVAPAPPIPPTPIAQFSAVAKLRPDLIRPHAPTKISGPVPSEADPELVRCREMEITSKKIGESDMRVSEEKATTDGIATCKQKAGYTADWESCSSTAGIYNSILAIERVLQTTQDLRSASSQQNIQAQANAQTSTGDGQNAIFDATLADNQFKKNLNREKLLAYTVAIAALGAKVASWKGISSVKCGGGPARSGEVPVSELPIVDCQDAIANTASDRPREVTANDSAKQAFSTALVGLLAKAAAAKAAIDRLDRNSAVVNAAKGVTNTPDGAPVFEKCVITPLDPECIERSGRTAAAGFSQGDFSAGEGFGNNAFDLGAGATDDATEDSGAATTDGNGAVAGVSSPFGESAKTANGILDPAAAASITPGAAGGGGGGGVGGGLGGGGGASLGNDLQGEDKDNKAKDIEANKLAGNYNSVGGKGFNAVAGGKEDNPFQNLFDSKSEGGVEEDRSIASDDGGKDSGLFQRISNKMSQVVAEKRIEASNLE